MSDIPRSRFAPGRVPFVGLLVALCLLALCGQALAARDYHPVASSFKPFPAGAFDGVAVDNSTGASTGDIYTVGEKRTIYEFQPDGTLLGEVEIPEADGERTQGIAVDSSNTPTAGDVYVVVIGPPPGGEPPGTPLPTHGAVYRLTANGTLSPFVTGIADSPAGIALGPSGEVFLVQLGAPGSRIADVLEFSSSGAPLNEGKPVVEGLENPGGIAVDSHGDLYIANCSKEMGTVEFTPTGGGGFSAAKTIAAEGGCNGSDLTVDSQTGYVFLADENVVHVFDEAGSQIALGSEEPGSNSTYRYFAVGENEATGDIYAINSAAGFPSDVTLEEAQPGSEAPVIESELVSNIPAAGATLEAQINPNGHETEYELLLNGEQVRAGHIAVGDSGEPISVEVGNLKAGSSYTFSALATSSEGTTIGPDRSFTAGNPPGPQSETAAASNLSDTTATLKGTVYPDGASPTITYFFQYGTSTSYGASAPTPVGEIGGRASCGLPCGNGDPNQAPAAVSASLTGLQPGVTYHYRLVATGPEGFRGYGNDATFTTRSPLDPEAPTTEACQGPIQAGQGQKLCGTLNPNASAKTGYYFAYNKGESCTQGQKTVAGEEVQGQDVQVSAELSGLEANTRYSYCLVATNSHGETFGEGLTFKTERVPAAGPTITSLQATSGPASGGTTVTIQGDNLENIRSVHFGSVQATVVEEECGGHCEIVPYTVLTVQSPAHAPGTVDVTVETSSGVSSTSAADQYTYSASSEAPPGEVLTEPAQATANGFKLKGKLNPENSPTTYYFIYKKSGEVECEDIEGCGPETAHGGPLEGDTQQDVSPAEVTGLTPGATYVYWLIAKNAKGTVRGNELTLTVPAHARPLGEEETPSSSNETPSTTNTGGGSGTPSGGIFSSPLSTTPLGHPPLSTAAPKVLSRAQKLTRALKACKKEKSKRKRAACEKQAHKKYAPRGKTTHKKHTP
ncbi:MAG TPA: IPT/TIG domain-containing protein [Solirubrobacteraceae bacterium]